jgi:DNA-binding HxlR family transcriptional regulator
MPRKGRPLRRSGCPVSVSLEIFGDRWSLLIVRDLMVRGFRTFTELRESGEGIATNVLADRLQRLESAGIIEAEGEETDGRRVNYRLTAKGIDLAPVLLELLVWGARHEETGAPCALVLELERRRGAFLAEVRRRWRDRDPRPLIPRFAGVDFATVRSTVLEGRLRQPAETPRRHARGAPAGTRRETSVKLRKE